MCLLSALTVDELRSAAFACWFSMLTHLGEEDVEALVETTFFIIGEYWPLLDGESQEKSQSLLRFLLQEHGETLQSAANKLPSLDHIDELSEFWRQLDAQRTTLDPRNAFAIFIQRLLHENSGVVQKGLAELSEYLGHHQGYLQTSAVSEQPDPVVAELIRALLDCASKYNNKNARVSQLCAECIGMVGCLDSNRLETVREQREFIVTSNFKDAEETTNFVAFILEEVLVTSFVSTTDVNLQGFLSYVMQELLARCDFTAAVANTQQGNTDTGTERIYKKWLKMPESVRDVLVPFLTSRYKLAPMAQVSAEYPILRAGRSYPNWLRQFTLNLLYKAQNTFSEIIFEPLCRAIRVKDLSVAMFLLPYLVVHITLGQISTTEEKDVVWNELLMVLQQDLPDDASYRERDDRRLCCEVSFRGDYF